MKALYSVQMLSFDSWTETVSAALETHVLYEGNWKNASLVKGLL